MLDDVAVGLVFIGQTLRKSCEPQIWVSIHAPKMGNMAKRVAPLLGLILHIAVTFGIMPVRMCMVPDCMVITVKSSEVRNVYATACNTNKVTIVGDPKGVRIHPLNGALCGKYSVVFQHNFMDITQFILVF